MQKLACVFALSMILALACASSADQEAFDQAVTAFTDSHPEVHTMQGEFQDTLIYLYSLSHDEACVQSMVKLQLEQEEKAVQQWKADNSKLESIFMNLITVDGSVLISEFKTCASQDILKRDELAFEKATEKVLARSPLGNEYMNFVDELRSLLRRENPSTCIQNVVRYSKSVTTGNIGLFVKTKDAITIFVDMVKVKFPRMVKMANECLKE